MIYIGIEELVANALIELNIYNIREVSFNLLDKYGLAVIEIINKNKQQARLNFSKNSTDDFLYNYSEYFELFDRGKEQGIRLRKNVNVKDLWKKFRGCLSADVMLAFMDKKAVEYLIK